MAWVGALIGAGAGIIGNEMSQQGQQQTNAQMLQQNKDIMNWETEMSNTAMTRRVADLKSSGLNPLLAVGQGGASVPSMSAVPLGNPSAPWGNLGGQVSQAEQAGSAMQSAAAQASQAGTASKVGASTSNANNAAANRDQALADKTAGVDTDEARARIARMDVQNALDNARADSERVGQQMTAQEIAESRSRQDQIAANIENLKSATTLNGAETALRNIQTATQGVTYRQQVFMTPDIIAQMRTATESAGVKLLLDKSKLPEAQNWAAMSEKNPGISYIGGAMSAFFGHRPQ